MADHHTFSTGANRSKLMPLYSAIPARALRRVAMRATGAPKGSTAQDQGFDYEGGSLKYGYGNWRRGLPMEDTFNHVIQHLMDWKASIESGRSPQDDDLSAAAWGILLPLMHFELEYAIQYAYRNDYIHQHPQATPEEVDAEMHKVYARGVGSSHGYLLMPLAPAKAGEHNP